MWTEFFYSVELSGQERAAIGALFATTETNFNKLTAIAGLDPRTDFRGLDLQNIDMSDCDLRGHDFSGADLRGVYGLNLITNETTIFKGARVDGSVFAFHVEQSRFLDANQHWAKQFRRLRGAEWMSVELWLGANLLGPKSNREHANRVAMLLFDTTTDKSVQSSIMYYGTRLFSSSETYKSFLIAQLSRDGTGTLLASTALRILAQLHYDDPLVFQLMRKFLTNNDYVTRELAVTGLLNSSRFQEVRDELCVAMRSEPSEHIRRSYVRRISKKLGTIYEYICFDGREYLDFNNPISSNDVERIALRWLGDSLPPHDNKNPQRAKQRAQIIEECAERVKSLFLDLVRAGVPFRVELEGAERLTRKLAPARTS